jgi:hypothetical protein
MLSATYLVKAFYTFYVTWKFIVVFTKATIVPYPQPVEPNPNPLILFKINYNIIFTPRFPRDPFHSAFSQPKFYTPFSLLQCVLYAPLISSLFNWSKKHKNQNSYILCVVKLFRSVALETVTQHSSFLVELLICCWLLALLTLRPWIWRQYDLPKVL